MSSQNKSNHMLKKLCAKSFINSKKEENKNIQGNCILRNSTSTKKSLKVSNSKEKYNTFRETDPNKQNIKQNEFIDNYKNNKKRSVIMNKMNNNLNNKLNKQKVVDFINDNKNNNNDIKVNNNKSFNQTMMNNYKNSNLGGHNKTANHIRIKNPKLNSVLYSNNEYKSNKDAIMRNYNSLNKNKNTINKSLNYSMSKGYHKESKKRINNSFRIQENTNKILENTKLKIKLKRNKSIEKGYINFYKYDKKFHNFNIKNINEKKPPNLNKTLAPTYSSPIDTSESIIESNTERPTHEINCISSAIQISINGKEDGNENEKEQKNISENENKAQKTKKLNLDVLKLKIENIKSNILSDIKTEREKDRNRDTHKNIKEKSLTSTLPWSSRSVHKRKKINSEMDNEKNVIKKIIKNKKKNTIKKRNDIITEIKNQNNSEMILKKEKSKKLNKLIKSININKTKKENKNGIEKKRYATTLHDNNLICDDIFDKALNKKNNKIFEIISDVKVKSFIEYEEDKKLNKSSNDNTDSNKKDIDTNININKILNSNSTSNEHDTSNKNSNGKKDNEKFIEDRDEYNVILKETFSKDRFSFRPTNNDNDSNETFQDSKFQKNKTLDKQDFLNAASSEFKIDNNNMKKIIPIMKKNKNGKSVNGDKNKKLVKSKSKELKTKNK
jgi:hypothetical protein